MPKVVFGLRQLPLSGSRRMFARISPIPSRCARHKETSVSVYTPASYSPRSTAADRSKLVTGSGFRSLSVGIGNVIEWLLTQDIRSSIDRIERSDIGRRLTRGSFWSLVGLLVSRGCNLAAMILLARMLGKIEFGEIGMVQTSLGMVQTLAGFGLGWAATKYVAEFRSSDKNKAGRIIAFCNFWAGVTGGFMALVFLVLAPWLAVHALAAPNLIRPLQIGSLLLLATTLAGTQTAILVGFEAFKSIARINFVSGSLSLPLIVGGGWIFGVEGAVWGMILGNALNWFLNHKNLRTVAIRSGILISRNGCWHEKRILWHFALPVVLGGTLSTVAEWVCSVMLVNHPGGYGQMGYYNAANQWFTALLFLPGVLGQAAIPVLSEHLGEKDFMRARKIFLYSVKVNLGLIVPLVLLGSLLSPWIMGFYGKDFGGAWATLVLALLTAGIVALQAPAGQIMTASGRMWTATIINLSYAIVFITATVVLVRWGSVGLAGARGVAYCIYALWSFKLAFGVIGKSDNKPSLASLPLSRYHETG